MDINSIFFSSPTLTAKAEAAIEKYEKTASETTDTSQTQSTTDSYVKSSASTTSSETGIYSKASIRKTFETIEAQRSSSTQQTLKFMLNGQTADELSSSLLNIDYLQSAKLSINLNDKDSQVDSDE